MCDWIYRLLIGLMSLLIMITPLLWRILIRGNYSEGYKQVPILYLGIMFNCLSSTIGGIYIAHMRTKSVGLTTMYAAIFNILIDICLVNVIGIWAGSISTLISFFALWLFRMIDIQKIQKLNINIKIIVMGLLALSSMCIINYLNLRITNIINIVLSFAIILIFDKDIICNLIASIGFKRI